MVTPVDQVLAFDIICIHPGKGFLYLVAVLDLVSRKVLNWRLSTSLDMLFCLDAAGKRPQ